MSQADGFISLPKALWGEVLLELPGIKAKEQMRHTLFVSSSFSVSEMYNFRKLTLDNFG